MLVNEIFRTVADLKREGRTILLVEQNAKKALQCADRGYVLETGSIVLTGSGEALLGSEACPLGAAAAHRAHLIPSPSEGERTGRSGREAWHA